MITHAFQSKSNSYVSDATTLDNGLRICEATKNFTVSSKLFYAINISKEILVKFRFAVKSKKRRKRRFRNLI